ncbi:hypothetical protein Ddye_009349 [Dipteronia dyeriana]|uniref:BED-type domain-containing protein n=1 Tax=Dipteronia dyeriana TaxID=168575 RepID=A0AAD9XBL2_9ROSI|nr:hypothetical protein Ddye_009349 [Dipteronia dyeriana]
MASMPDSNTNLNTTSNVHVSSDASNTASVLVGRKRKFNDVGWEFGILIDEKNPDKVQCTLCKKVFSGGVDRLKEHVTNIVGNVVSCRKASKDNQLRKMRSIMNLCVNCKEGTTFLSSKDSFAESSCATHTINLMLEEILYPDDLDMQNFLVNIEFGKYLNKESSFGRPLALKGCEKNDEFYNPAKRIISLTTSSSGSKINWSTCEGIHTKKRNRLDTNRLNNLVYVQFNSRLMDKRKRRTDKNIDILLANDASNVQGWIVDDGDDEVEPGSGLDDGEMRDLEDDFQSDDEAVEENVEFESDDDVVFQLEEYIVEDESLEYQS